MIKRFLVILLRIVDPVSHVKTQEDGDSIEMRLRNRSKYQLHCGKENSDSEIHRVWPSSSSFKQESHCCGLLMLQPVLFRSNHTYCHTALSAVTGVGHPTSEPPSGKSFDEKRLSTLQSVARLQVMLSYAITLAVIK